MTKGFHKPHVVAVPYLALGHSIPFLDLAMHLASHGLTVSYVTTPANVACLEQPIHEALNNGLDIRVVVLPSPVVEGLPEGCENTDLVPSESRGLIRELMSKLEHPFHTWMENQFHEETLEPPLCVIHDMCIGWAADTAQEYNIPSFLFNTCGAFGTILLRSISCSILQNCVSERRGGQRCAQLGSATTYQIGQTRGRVFPPKFLGSAGNVSARGKMADISEGELVSWLDSQCLRSVVYVSFGSQTFLSQQQTNALARGLEGSEQPFVWAFKVSPNIETTNSDSADLASTYLPEGFLERTKKRGMVIWGGAPQLLILSHPSVGAFMSHCGWNSTLESITHGVPIVAWPMFGDQRFNSKLITELGIGIQFCQDKDGLPDKERVKEVLRRVLIEDKGKEIGKRTVKLKEMAEKAVKQEGSSAADLQAF
ncbi:hypothetical protein KI387_027549, partial [Taxus chinensis]